VFTSFSPICFPQCIACLLTIVAVIQFYWLRLMLTLSAVVKARPRVSEV
jgi:hypothetical protein